MDKRLGTIMGDAPRLAAALLPALAAGLGISLAWPGAFAFQGAFRGVAVAAGIELAAFGLVFWASAAYSLVRAWRADRLATRGAYGLCRHPIFSWWIFSVIPAAALLLDSWLLLAVAILFRILSGRLAEREEAALYSAFGQEYAAYARRTRAFLPLPLLRPFTVRRCAKALAGLVAAAVLALGVWLAAARPAILSLGATRAELAEAFPGDSLISQARTEYNQALDIAAPAAEVWKWLVQVGYRRAGWYNVDAINRLAAPDYFIDGRGSSTRIHPELQGLRVGDKIFLVPALGLTVTALEPERSLVLAGDPGNPDADWNLSMAYRLQPRGEGACRLLTRVRGSFRGGALAGLMNDLFMEVGGAMLQQQAMLQGIKARAERARSRG